MTHVVIYRRATDLRTRTGLELDVRGVWLFDRNPTSKELLALALEADRKDDPDVEWSSGHEYKYLTDAHKRASFQVAALFLDGDLEDYTDAGHFEIHQAKPQVSYGDAVEIKDVPIAWEATGLPSSFEVETQWERASLHNEETDLWIPGNPETANGAMPKALLTASEALAYGPHLELLQKLASQVEYRGDDMQEYLKSKFDNRAAIEGWSGWTEYDLTLLRSWYDLPHMTQHRLRSTFA